MNAYFENSVIPTVLHCTLTLRVLCIVRLFGNSKTVSSSPAVNSMKVFVNLRATAATLHLCVSFIFPSLGFCSQKKVVGQSCSMCLAWAASITTGVKVAP